MPEDKLRLHMTLIDPPMLSGTEFGLQDKDQTLHAGEVQPDGSMVFSCEVKVTDSDGAVRFTGPFVHGSGVERHLYLSLRAEGSSQWSRRIKVMLTDIDPHIVHRAIDSGIGLECTVDGTKPARARLIGDGWTLRNA